MSARNPTGTRTGTRRDALLKQAGVTAFTTDGEGRVTSIFN